MTEDNTKSTTSGATPKPYDIEPNVEAALSYIIAPLSGIFVFAMEKENKFVRFHAFQSILFGIAVVILISISKMLIFILLSFLLVPLISLAAFCIWLMLMWKAYNNEEYELPYLGRIAKDQVYKK